MITADVVVVGSGSGGGVLAARLSEDPKLNVVLVEAGRDRSANLFVDMPAGSYAMMGNAVFDWAYTAEADPTIMDRKTGWSGGKMLGGSSSINGMVYVRGNSGDYDRWVEAGAAGWDWPTMLSYFRKAENYQGAPSQFHGQTGPLVVGRASARHELSDAVIGAFAANGLPHLDEYCAGDQYGVYDILTTAHGGRRRSVAVCYLREARKRPNFRVIEQAIADQVLIENGQAVGVRVIRHGRSEDIRAREVVISAGAIQSPTILMRSGVGPAAELARHGIPVVADLPVGQNLQEHNGISISRLVNVPTYNSPFGPWTIGKNLVRWLLTKSGPMASAAVHVMAGLKSSPELEEADLAVSFIPLAIAFENGRPKMADRPGITIGGNCMRPDSRGEIRLRSRDANDHPLIDHRMLSDERDVRRLISLGKQLEQVFTSEPLASHVVGRNLPATAPQTDAEWEALIREIVGIGYHPVGTCAMGGEGAVLDPRLRVRGVRNLRVADASAIPRIVSGNTNAATIALGERAADLMREDMAA